MCDGLYLHSLPSCRARGLHCQAGPQDCLLNQRKAGFALHRCAEGGSKPRTTGMRGADERDSEQTRPGSRWAEQFPRQARGYRSSTSAGSQGTMTALSRRVPGAPSLRAGDRLAASGAGGRAELRCEALGCDFLRSEKAAKESG